MILVVNLNIKQIWDMKLMICFYIIYCVEGKVVGQNIGKFIVSYIYSALIFEK